MKRSLVTPPPTGSPAGASIVGSAWKSCSRVRVWYGTWRWAGSSSTGGDQRVGRLQPVDPRGESLVRRGRDEVRLCLPGTFCGWLWRLPTPLSPPTWPRPMIVGRLPCLHVRVTARYAVTSRSSSPTPCRFNTETLGLDGCHIYSSRGDRPALPAPYRGSGSLQPSIRNVAPPGQVECPSIYMAQGGKTAHMRIQADI